MATINYKGMELEQFEPDESQVFIPPLKGVFECCGTLHEGYLYSYDERFKSPYTDQNNSTWPNFALLPDPPKPRRPTRRELSKWLAQGNGEMKIGRSHEPTTDMWRYNENRENEDIGEGIVIRKWSDTEWHEPTVDYLGLEDVK